VEVSCSRPLAQPKRRREPTTVLHRPKPLFWAAGGLRGVRGWGGQACPHSPCDRLVARCEPLLGSPPGRLVDDPKRGNGMPGQPLGRVRPGDTVRRDRVLDEPLPVSDRFAGIQPIAQDAGLAHCVAQNERGCPSAASRARNALCSESGRLVTASDRRSHWFCRSESFSIAVRLLRLRCHRNLRERIRAREMWFDCGFDGFVLALLVGRMSRDPLKPGWPEVVAGLLVALLLTQGLLEGICVGWAGGHQFTLNRSRGSEVTLVTGAAAVYFVALLVEAIFIDPFRRALRRRRYGHVRFPWL